MGRDASFEIGEIKGLQALTDNGVDFAGPGLAMKAFEPAKMGVNLSKSGPTLPAPGGMA